MSLYNPTFALPNPIGPPSNGAIILGTAIATALAPQEPYSSATSSPPAPPPPKASAPAPLPANPTPTQLDGYQSQMKSYQAYRGYLAQLTSWESTVSLQQQTFITICNNIITYFVDNTIVEPGSFVDGYHHPITGTGFIT